MHTTRTLLVALLVLAPACRDREEDAKPEVPITVARNAGTTTTAALAAGDVRIVNSDSAVDLALIGDTISGGLSEHALAKAREGTDTTKVTGTGFGADIEKMVKGTVQSALATRVAFPLSAVNDVRYENGRIVFDWNGKPRSFGTVRSNKKDILESFSEAEAQRFVEAVRARKRGALAQ